MLKVAFSTAVPFRLRVWGAKKHVRLFSLSMRIGKLFMKSETAYLEWYSDKMCSANLADTDTTASYVAKDGHAKGKRQHQSFFGVQPLADVLVYDIEKSLKNTFFP